MNPNGFLKYNALLEEASTIYDKCNGLNGKLIRFKMPWFWWKVKKELNEYIAEYDTIQEEFIEWYNKMDEYAKSPEYIINEPSPRDLSIIFHSDILFIFRHQNLEKQVIKLADNVCLRIAEYNNQKNFVIAISSFLVTLLGLIVALI